MQVESAGDVINNDISLTTMNMMRDEHIQHRSTLTNYNCHVSRLTQWHTVTSGEDFRNKRCSQRDHGNIVLKSDSSTQTVSRSIDV